MWVDEAGEVGGHQSTGLRGRAEESGLCPQAVGGCSPALTKVMT